MTVPFVLAPIYDKIPFCRSSPYLKGMADGTLGEANFFYMKLSRDGATFYPTVIGVPADSAAKRAGLKMWDMVIAVNGTSTANIRERDLIDLCTGKIGEVIAIRVGRMGKVLDLNLPLQPLDDDFRRLLRNRMS